MTTSPDSIATKHHLLEVIESAIIIQRITIQEKEIIIHASDITMTVIRDMTIFTNTSHRTSENPLPKSSSPTKTFPSWCPARHQKGDSSSWQRWMALSQIVANHNSNRNRSSIIKYLRRQPASLTIRKLSKILIINTHITWKKSP